MRIEIFGADADWYWRFRSSNGQIVAPSEGYVTKSNARRAARRFVLKIVGQLTNSDYSTLWAGNPGSRLEIVDVDE